MDWPQIVSGWALVVLLLALAGYGGYRQLRALRRQSHDLPSEERRHERARALRRLVSAGLLFLLACLLAGALVYLEEAAQRLADLRGAAAQNPSPPELTPEQKGFARLYAITWIAILLVLLVVLLLAAVDQWSTRRFGLRQLRKLHEDRRAMIRRQANRLRQDRNGLN